MVILLVSPSTKLRMTVPSAKLRMTIPSTKLRMTIFLEEGWKNEVGYLFNHVAKVDIISKLGCLILDFFVMGELELQ